MDIRLRSIAASAAGTYFLLTDSTPVPEIFTTGKLRLFFINTDKGPVNTVVLFKKNEKTSFQNIFGKRMRKQEKLGNFSIYNVLEALTTSDVAVMNLRKFTTLDKVGISGLNPNMTNPETDTTEYANIFNRNGLWTIKPKQIREGLDNTHYLNFANIGKSNISYFVVKSNTFDTITAYGNQSLINVPLEIEEYPALDSDMLLKDTIVDVYIFNNTFENASTNKFYGQFFNAGGLIESGKIDALTNIVEAGFAKKLTGSLIPNLKNEFNEAISIDTVINNNYAETGLVCYINDDVLEDETLGGLPILNTELTGYYQLTGNLGGVGTFLSYRCQPVTPIVVDMDLVKSDVIKDLSNEFMVTTKGAIFPENQLYGNNVYSVFENNIRLGDKLYFTDKLTNKINNVEVIGLELVEQNLPNKDGNKERLTKSVITPLEVTNTTVKFSFSEVENATDYVISRRTEGTGLATDNTFMQISTVQNFGEFTDINLTNGNKYVYLVTAKSNDYITSFSNPKEFTLGGELNTAVDNGTIIPDELPDEPLSNVKWNKLLLKTTGKINADSYTRQLNITKFDKAKILPTTLTAYIPRQEQFLNGTPSRQNEILDVMLETGIVKGLKNVDGLRYLVDCFKSFVEPGYKYQFGQLTVDLDKTNKFVRAIINEPFVEDLEKSTNPLFKDYPGGTFDFQKYLSDGGNSTYSTVFLSKFSLGSENCFYFGSESDEMENEYITSGKVSNLFYSKTNAWDIVANTTGYFDVFTGIPFNPDKDERKAMEAFSWNPIIKTNKGFTIYGNLTGQKNRTSLAQIHNSELLAYIKETLEQMSRDEAFKKGTYNEYLATEVEYQSFMNELALVGAVKPNPVVICSAVNNPEDVQAQKIKVIHVEYGNINGIEKVVFDLKLV